MPARDRSGLFFMKHNFKKAVAISLAATLVCGCFSGCKKKDDNVATSEATPVTTPTVNQTDTPSVEHNVTGDVDTSGGNKTVSGKPVLTKLVVGTPNNCNQNGYMEATSIDGEYCYKQKEKATKYKNPVPFENGDGSNTILSTGHTVYIRKLYDDAETSNTEDLEEVYKHNYFVPTDTLGVELLSRTVTLTRDDLNQMIEMWLSEMTDKHTTIEAREYVEAYINDEESKTLVFPIIELEELVYQKAVKEKYHIVCERGTQDGISRAMGNKVIDFKDMNNESMPAHKYDDDGIRRDGINPLTHSGYWEEEQ